jgi:KTSC domain
MERVAVISSNISTVGYDPTSATMEVEFTSGAVYQYFDVPRSIFEAVISSASVGSSFQDLVKDRYRYIRVQ